MKVTYEDILNIMEKLHYSKLDKETKYKLNCILYDLKDRLKYNKETRLLDYDIDLEDELDEHKYYY